MGLKKTKDVFDDALSWELSGMIDGVMCIRPSRLEKENRRFEPLETLFKTKKKR